MKNDNCSEKAESLVDEVTRKRFRCEQILSAQPIFMGLRIICVKVLNRYKKGKYLVKNCYCRFCRMIYRKKQGGREFEYH